jgi:hypothetical protein
MLFATDSGEPVMASAWHEPIDVSRLPLAGMLAAVVGVGINIALCEAGILWFDVPSSQNVLSLIVVSAATVVAVIVAALVLAFFAHTQARPFSLFKGFVALMLIISFAAPLIVWAGWIPSLQAPETATVSLLAIMHVTTAIVILAFFTTIPRRALPRHRF